MFSRSATPDNSEAFVYSVLNVLPPIEFGVNYDAQVLYYLLWFDSFTGKGGVNCEAHFLTPLFHHFNGGLCPVRRADRNFPLQLTHKSSACITLL